MSIAQGFDAVRSRMSWWILGGMLEQKSSDIVRSAINKSPQAAQVTTVTMTDQGDDDDVIITINGEDISYDTGTGKSLATIGAEFAEAINENPVARGVCTASFDTATLTLTGNWPGQSFTVSIASDPDSVLSSVTEVTAADEADPIGFGCGVIRTGRQNTDELVALAKSTQFTAQVVTSSIAYVDAAVISIEVFEVRGAEKHRIAFVSEASATSRDATVDALVTLLNAQLPANSVIAAADNATATAIVFTAEIAGLEFEVRTSAWHEGASLPAVSDTNTTGPSQSTSIHRAFRGVAIRHQGTPSRSIGSNETEYPGNATLAYCERGIVAVESSQTITSGDNVYIDLATGKFRNSSSSTSVALARARAVWEQDANSGTGDLAALRLM